LGGRKGIRPVKKTEWWGAGVVACLERGADLHMAQLMPLPLTVSCFSEIQIGFTLLVPAHPGSPGQMAVKRVCVCVCVHVLPSQSLALILAKLNPTQQNETTQNKWSFKLTQRMLNLNYIKKLTINLAFMQI